MKNIICAVVLIFSVSAHATGGYVCKASDTNADIEISATTASMPGSPLIQPTSIVVKIKAAQKGAIYFDKLVLSEENVVQYWNRNDALNMHITYEAGDEYYALANLVIETKSVKGKEFQSSGDYELELTVNKADGQSNSQMLKGKINCELE